MPRNTGTNIYAVPVGTDGIPDTTIESVTYNNYIHDVEKDLNDPRPIIAGGTGADDADEALANLGAEKAAQIVTNYDTHVWIPGSFRSLGGATAAPVSGHAFAGIVYINENYINPPANFNVVVSARDMSDTVVPSRVYVREKKSNVWGAWTVIDATTLPFTPIGGLSATTIMAAIQELEAEKASLTFVAATYAPINSPLFTGDARAPTPPTVDNDTTLATTAFVYSAIAATGAGAVAPVDALSSNGLQINGSMEVNQPGNNYVTTHGAYGCDGWKLGKVGTMAVRFGPSGDPLAYPKGFASRLYIDVATAQASLGGNDYVCASQPVEGYRAECLAWGTAGAQPITIGFWSANKVAGVYSVAITGVAGMSYAATYTQSVASTYQYNTITVPGPTTGSWFSFNGVGITLHFTVAAGVGVTTAAANTWYTGQYFAAPGQINGASAINNAVLSITGVFILPGAVPIPASRSALIMRPYSDELARSQRYYQRIAGQDNASIVAGWAQNSLVAWFGIRFPTMRVAPTITLSGPGVSGDFYILDPGYSPWVASTQVLNVTFDSAKLECTATQAFLTVNHIVLLLGANNNSFITLDARL